MALHRLLVTITISKSRLLQSVSLPLYLITRECTDDALRSCVYFADDCSRNNGRWWDIICSCLPAEFSYKKVSFCDILVNSWSNVTEDSKWWNMHRGGEIKVNFRLQSSIIGLESKVLRDCKMPCRNPGKTCQHGCPIPSPICKFNYT